MTGTHAPTVTLKHRIGKHIIPRLPINRRTFDVLRFEVDCLKTRALNILNPSMRAKIRSLRARRELSVNLGSGGTGRPDWINTDARWHADVFMRLDIRSHLPFSDASVRRLLAEHVVEHIDFNHDVPRLFAEIRRVLMPGGVVRIIVPDAERYLRAYTAGNNGQWQALGWDLDHMPDDILTPMHAINHIFHQGGEHLFAYDYETMQLALQRAGFNKVMRQSYGVSVDPELAIDQPKHARYSLYVDAIK